MVAFLLVGFQKQGSSVCLAPSGACHIWVQRWRDVTHHTDNTVLPVTVEATHVVASKVKHTKIVTMDDIACN